MIKFDRTLTIDQISIFSSNQSMGGFSGGVPNVEETMACCPATAPDKVMVNEIKREGTGTDKTTNLGVVINPDLEISAPRSPNTRTTNRSP
jgi:hypothetical protein